MSIYALKSASSRCSKCSICEQSVKSPKQLPCDHKFCRDCINHQISRLSTLLGADEKVSIVCPYCRDFFLSSVSVLKEGNSKSESKTNKNQPYQYQKQLAYSGDRKVERCQPCAEGAHYELAFFWCKNCSEYMCSSCAKYHSAMKMSKHHIVKTIRDKERYEAIGARVYEPKRPSSASHKKMDIQSTPCPHDRQRQYCEPCKQRKKTKYARFLCETCSERLCDDCTKCHRSMKMSKTHSLIPMKDVMSKQASKYTEKLMCDKHYNESLGLFCKYCQTSCCSICAVTDHSRCAKKIPVEKKDIPVKQDQSKNIAGPKGILTEKAYYAWGPNPNDKKENKMEKIIKFDSKPNARENLKKQEDDKSKIPPNKMELRKGRLEVESFNDADWVISMALLSNGDILLLQLYESSLKLMDSLGNVVATCSCIGHPWSVAVYNDSLAVVSFSDRKQLQLVNVTKSGLELGKRFGTRHTSLAVCFARNLIATTCWEGCVHVFNISGQEVASIDRDVTGQRLFTNPEYIAADKMGTRLYISDYKRNSVTALQLLPNKIENKPQFVFIHKDLQGPKGVSVDREGTVYISGMASRNIFRVSSSGQLIQIYRRREDTDYYEDIAISSNGDKLLVSAYEDNTIIVLRFKK